MRRVLAYGALILTAGLWVPVALALEDCNTSPKSGQDIAETLQCLDRNIKSLAQQSGGGSSGSSGPSGNVALSGRYMAGAYLSPDSKEKFQVTGPTKMGSREKWQISSDDGTIQISWITGAPKGHPMLLGTKIADELSEAYDYGRMGKTSGIAGIWWTRGRLIGVTPTNDGLTVSYFAENDTDIIIEKASFSVRLSKTGK
ncbi:MAG: hypothetical protein Q8L77_12480 [Nitrospirota bacterium]|nr:hypothetical protein [Nitrospirota bacterium]